MLGQDRYPLVGSSLAEPSERLPVSLEREPGRFLFRHRFGSVVRSEPTPQGRLKRTLLTDDEELGGSYNGHLELVTSTVPLNSHEFPDSGAESIAGIAIRHRRQPNPRRLCRECRSITKTKPVTRIPPTQTQRQRSPALAGSRVGTRRSGIEV